MKKFISILLAVCLLLSLGSTAFAAGTTTRQAELYYREVKILLDGKELIPQDVNGKSTEPFIIDGTTYLPIRAVASALGLKVEWKAETSSIHLTAGGEANYGSGESVGTKRIVSATLGYRGIKLYMGGKLLSLKDANGKTVEPFLMGGTTYVPVRAIADALGLSVDWNGFANTVILDSGKGYFPSKVTRSVTGPTSSYTETIEYSYTEDGAPTGVKYRSTAGKSYTAAIKYDDAMRITRFAVTGSFSFGFEHKYDKAGRLIYEKNWSGSDYTECSTSYTDTGLVASETLTRRSGGVTTKTSFSYTYDKNGQLTKEVSKTGNSETVTEYSYNSRGDVSLVLTTMGKDVRRSEYKYDPAGQLLSIFSYTNGWLDGKSLYEYDAQGRMVSSVITSPHIEKTTIYSYDSHGNVLCESYSDTDGLVRVTENEYDRYGNLSARTVEEQGVNYSGPYSFSEQYEYEYSPDGLLLWRSRSDSNGGSGSYKASYDALGRNTFTEISIDGTITSTLLTQYELGPWPVYQASIATGSGSTVIEAEYKTFASDKYQELVELVNSLLSGE